jgi:hypothetical protein
LKALHYTFDVPFYYKVVTVGNNNPRNRQLIAILYEINAFYICLDINDKLPLGNIKNTSK